MSIRMGPTGRIDGRGPGRVVSVPPVQSVHMTNTKRSDGRLLTLSAEMRRGYDASEAGNPADALKINRALATDPLAQPFQNSFDIVSKHIRTALADESRPVDDPSTPRLYDILTGAGEADVMSHVAMALSLIHISEPTRPY